MLKKSIVKWLIAPALILSFSSLGFAEVEGTKTTKPALKKLNNKAPAAAPHKMGKKMGHNKPMPTPRKLAKAKPKAPQKMKKHAKKHHKAKAKKQGVQQKAKPAIKDVEDL